MYSPLTRELQDAYNSIYLRENIDQDVHKFSQYFMDVLVEEGYDISNITENDLYDFFVSEGAGSLLMRAVKPFIAGAKPIAKGLLQKSGVGAMIAVPAAALDQYLTGGKGREWVGAGVQGLRQLGHSIPSPDQAKKMLQPPGPGGQTEPPKPPAQRPSQQNQRNPYGLRKEGVNISPQQKSLLEEPKIGEKNKEGKIWTGTDFGYQSQATLDKQKAERAKAEREALQVVKGGQAGYKSLMPKPTAQKGETAQAFDARMKRYEKSQSLAKNLTRQAQIKAEQERLKGVGNPPDTAPKPDQKSPASKPDSEPATTKPKPTPKPPTPAPTPFSKSVSAPPAASLDKYKINKDWAAANPRLAQAQVARASGQPRADINKILYKPGTAAYGASGESEMERQAKELKDKREAIVKQREADKIGPKAQSALPGDAYSPAATAKMTTRTKNILGVKEQYDAYDLVLEYLLSEGHVDTVDEAHYVMLQMDAGYIQSIVEAEVLAMKGGVPGSVKVKPALSIPGTDIGIGPNKPVPGTFTTTTPGQREKIAKGDTTIDRGTYQQSRVGAGPTSAERQRYNAELIKQGKHTAPRMPQ